MSNHIIPKNTTPASVSSSPSSKASAFNNSSKSLTSLDVSLHNSILLPSPAISPFCSPFPVSTPLIFHPIRLCTLKTLKLGSTPISITFQSTNGTLKPTLASSLLEGISSRVRSRGKVTSEGDTVWLSFCRHEGDLIIAVQFRY